MTDPKKEISQLQEEMDTARQEAQKQSNGEFQLKQLTKITELKPMIYVINWSRNAWYVLVVGGKLDDQARKNRDQVEPQMSSDEFIAEQWDT